MDPLLCVFCVSYAFTSVHCCFVVTHLEGADLLLVVLIVFCYIPCGILVQVWYSIVSFPGISHFTTFICKSNGQAMFY